MRIPLDYYQILGVPFDATPEQIQQSYEDRLQQLPKQQYSAAAIASRKKLLLEAHSILLNPKRRQEHDQSLFPDIDQPYEDPNGEDATALFDRGVDVDSTLLAGALILLLEFGEFDSVLELGMTHLNRSIDLQKMPDEVGPMDDDVALAVSIANLELGREHWQQGDCEEAGQCLQAGLKILHSEGKFLDIQAEIETDLSKLRPYRVLDLLALEETDPKRADGLSLLQDMLDERGGMEGQGDDQSGLSVNDFLLFMQQLRDNLTVDEQFNLFRAESMRPSSVATYLSVYAHVARGISEYEPSLISQAKSLLASLADRQDLSLEQGMCSLLLGQPDAAEHCVQQSTDEEAIAFITDYSEGAPDIIPGLYLYTEQWLQQEVYPYFRDLNKQTVALEDYFNHEGVQRQLSELEPDLPNVDTNWEASGVDAKWERWLSETTQADSTSDESLPSTSSIPSIPGSTQSPQADEPVPEKQGKTGPNWFTALTSSKAEPSTPESVVPSLDITDLEWAQETPEGAEESRPLVNSAKPSGQRTPIFSGPTSTQKTPKKKKGRLQEDANAPQGDLSTPVTSTASAKKPWVLWGASALLGIALIWGVLALGRLFQSSSSSSPQSSNPDVAQPSGSAIPDSSGSEGENSASTQSSEGGTTNQNSNNSSGELTKEAAKEIIQAWQKIKSEALGSSHQVEPLGQILMDPELTRWQYSADIAKDEGEYTTYDLKQLDILSLSMESPTQAVVQAKISESRNQYTTGSSEPFASIADDAYKVGYRLESLDGKWRIKEIDLLDE